MKTFEDALKEAIEKKIKNIHVKRDTNSLNGNLKLKLIVNDSEIFKKEINNKEVNTNDKLENAVYDFIEKGLYSKGYKVNSNHIVVDFNAKDSIYKVEI